MVYSLAYRRPRRVDSKRGSITSQQTEVSIGGSTLEDSQDAPINFGIPDALSFDRIIDGGTCPVGLSIQSKSSWQLGAHNRLSFASS